MSKDLYVIRKYIYASSAEEAIKKEKDCKVNDCYMHDSWMQEKIVNKALNLPVIRERIKDKVGFKK